MNCNRSLPSRYPHVPWTTEWSPCGGGLRLDRPINLRSNLQLTLNQAVLDGSIPSVILLVEHPPVITLGIHKDHNLLLSSPELLNQQGVECVPIRRGGGSTAHNPGQLVLYPIVSLPALGFRVAPFVHYLEQVGMDVLLAAGVEVQRRNRYPGLWVDGRKIASVGVQITRGVSMHGIAINLCNNLGIFDHIIPCGITGVEMTSALREIGSCPPMAYLKAVAEQSCFHHLPQQTTVPPTAHKPPTLSTPSTPSTSSKLPDRHHGDTP